ncbi:uncharacterized protein LOC123553386 [Mercenaria mercenaria]|uniref:uncharacterized protein LOC123553386 n=1 Tax=Mercenaria mercenaria TaxID=6596 RepID=UPI00234EC37D|nr:uncharacterized protein LOC123553386 [Mercenaria mercenaria]
MGAEVSKYSDGSLDLAFVGRENDMKMVRELLQKYKTIGIYGMHEIGKSRFLVELFRNMNKSGAICLMKDFELDDITSSYVHYKWFHDLFSYTDLQTKWTDFKIKFPGENIVCDICKRCGNKLSCESKKSCLEQAANAAIESVKSCKKQIMIFLDNVDKIIDSDLKDCLLHFIHELNEKCPKIKLVFCSNNEVKCLHKSYGRLVLGALAERSILKLIYLTTECPDDVSTSEYDDNVSNDKNAQNNETAENLFKQENQYFTPENKVYMDKIATLCEGHPLAAIISGSLLTEDEGILTPEELMEILTEARLEVLGQDHCPPDHRLDACETPLQKVKSVYRVIFNEKRIASEGILGDSSAL